METKFSAPVKTDPGAHPASCMMGIKFLSQWQSGQDVIRHKLRLKKEWSYTSIPLWAFKVCSGVNFILTFTVFGVYSDAHVESTDHYVSISEPSRVILLWKESGVHCEIMWNMCTALAEGRTVMKLNRQQGGAGFKNWQGNVSEKRRRQRENINDVFALLCCYTAFIGDWLLTFRIYLSAP